MQHEIEQAWERLIAHHGTPACIVCGDRVWILDDGITLGLGRSETQVPRSYVPTVRIVCTRCGQVLLFDAERFLKAN